MVILGIVTTLAVLATMLGWAACAAAGRADRLLEQGERDRHLSDDWRRTHSGGREY